MSSSNETATTEYTEQEIKFASNAALASILNLTFLPVLGFIWLVTHLNKSYQESIGHYHVVLGIKLNIIAAFSLLVVSGLMIAFGGFDSPWTWVYVITYFTLVHTIFIVIAVWAMVRSWSGNRLR
ncbi:MAG: hypothetical protein C0631_07075 [Sedimenticola sp.]|nr:MAG: hypothetical protein C0631_07075 [Sedimenticola sp.]